MDHVLILHPTYGLSEANVINKVTNYIYIFYKTSLIIIKKSYEGYCFVNKVF